ncbi:hypothetical protein AZ019_002138, partial [Klebsiella pneumoniae]
FTTSATARFPAFVSCIRQYC